MKKSYSKKVLVVLLVMVTINSLLATVYFREKSEALLSQRYGDAVIRNLEGKDQFFDIYKIEEDWVTLQNKYALGNSYLSHVSAYRSFRKDVEMFFTAENTEKYSLPD